MSGDIPVVHFRWKFLFSGALAGLQSAFDFGPKLLKPISSLSNSAVRYGIRLPCDLSSSIPNTLSLRLSPLSPSFFSHNTEKVIYFLLLERKRRKPAYEDDAEALMRAR